MVISGSVPGHADVYGNEVADRLAKRGAKGSTSTSPLSAEIFSELEKLPAPCPPAGIRSMNWLMILKCRMTKSFWTPLSMSNFLVKPMPCTPLLHVPLCLFDALLVLVNLLDLYCHLELFIRNPCLIQLVWNYLSLIQWFCNQVTSFKLAFL